MTQRAAVITVSDSAAGGTRADQSGPLAVRTLASWGYEVVATLTVADDRAAIEDAVRQAAATATLVVTTGGTGLGPRDVTPEATRAVIEREAPGLAELIRLRGLESTELAALSRGIAGIVGATLVINLPGSTAAVADGLTALYPVLRHALDVVAGEGRHRAGG